jgi:hypothetical protein
MKIPNALFTHLLKLTALLAVAAAAPVFAELKFEKTVIVSKTMEILRNRRTN